MRKFVIACVAVFVGLGCSKTTSPSAMGNTNWLLSCDSDTQCGAEAFCGCGVCTRTCESNNVCANLGDAVCDLSANKSCHDVQGLAAGEGVCVPAAIAPISDASMQNLDASVDAGYSLERSLFDARHRERMAYSTYPVDSYVAWQSAVNAYLGIVRSDTLPEFRARNWEPGIARDIEHLFLAAKIGLEVLVALRRRR